MISNPVHIRKVKLFFETEENRKQNIPSKSPLFEGGGKQTHRNKKEVKTYYQNDLYHKNKLSKKKR